jgi:seryl-tRNA synthetase
MIDPALLLNDFDRTAKRLGRRGVSTPELEALRSLLERRRLLQRELDEGRAGFNARSDGVGALVRGGRLEEADLSRHALSLLREKLATLEAEHRGVDEQCRDQLLRIPNIPSDDAPEGLAEAANVVREVFLYDPQAIGQRTYRPHWELASELGILDAERAAKLSGSMFALFRREGAALIRGLVRFALDLHNPKYEEILPPHFVRTEVFTGTGHLPKFEAEAYKLRDDDLWAIPTGEVPLMGMHRDEVIPVDALPKRYMAYTVCFRREAGSAGKDTRGTQRVHEFHKVELLKLVEPENVWAEFLDLVSDALRPLQMLGLPHRIVDLCCGDLTFASTRIWDIEVYAPGVDRWLEVSSVGIFSDFQTRRSNIRFRRGAQKPRYPYALNASALATPRVWAAIVEHGQQPDGSVIMPESLVPYLGFDRIPSKPR